MGVGKRVYPKKWGLVKRSTFLPYSPALHSLSVKLHLFSAAAHLDYKPFTKAAATRKTTTKITTTTTTTTTPKTTTTTTARWN